MATVETNASGLPDIFLYVDYRRYLADLVDTLARREPGFSLRAFARMAGSSSPNFYQLVKAGSLHPQPKHLTALSQALKLNRQERRYLRDLVALARSRPGEERRSMVLQVLEQAKRSLPSLVKRGQYDYFTRWYYPAIRALVACHPVTDNEQSYEEAAGMLRPHVKTAEFKEALSCLVDMGLVELGDDGVYRQTDSVVTTGDDVRSMQVMAFQTETIRLAELALEQCPQDVRDISTLTLNISGQSFESIRVRIRALRKEIIDMVTADAGDDRVYQCNMQFFPQSRPQGDCT